MIYLSGIKCIKMVLYLGKNITIACAIVATIAFFISFVFPEVTIAIALWGSAYWYAITIRWIDNANLWQKNT